MTTPPHLLRDAYLHTINLTHGLIMRQWRNYAEGDPAMLATIASSAAVVAINAAVAAMKKADATCANLEPEELARIWLELQIKNRMFPTDQEIEDDKLQGSR